jgi:hypothetical protein
VVALSRDIPVAPGTATATHLDLDPTDTRRRHKVAATGKLHGELLLPVPLRDMGTVVLVTALTPVESGVVVEGL